MPARHCGHRGEPPLVVYGFTDAIMVGKEAAETFARGHSAIVTDHRGTVVEVLAFTGPDHTAEHAIAAGLRVHSHDPSASRMVLVSILHGVDIGTPNELEVDMWERAVERCRGKGVDLWEWVLCSGELLRCLSITAKTQHVWRRR